MDRDQAFYTDAEWIAYMRPVVEEEMEQQKIEYQRYKREIAVGIAGTVIFCLLVIGYCVARIVL